MGIKAKSHLSFTREDGWTLTEVIVASAILGFIGLGLGQLLVFFSKGMRHVEKRLPPQRTVQAVMGIVQKDLISCSRTGFMNLLPDPGFEQSPFAVSGTIYPTSLRASATPIAGWWTYLPVPMHPTDSRYNASARINSSTLPNQGRAWLMASVGEIPGNLTVNSAYTPYGDTSLMVGHTARAEGVGGNCRAVLQVWSNLSGLVMSTSTTNSLWQTFASSFTAVSPAAYQIRLLTSNSGFGTCRGYFDNIHLSKHSELIGGTNPSGVIRFIHYDRSGNREWVRYNIVSSGGKTNFRRQVLHTDGTTSENIVSGLRQMAIGWKGGSSVVTGVDRPLVVDLEACGAESNCADPLSLSFEVFPVGR